MAGLDPAVPIGEAQPFRCRRQKAVVLAPGSPLRSGRDDRCEEGKLMKTNAGRFFEDFRHGDVIRHATPRTVTVGDAALYTALYGSRFAVQSSDTFAEAI